MDIDWTQSLTRTYEFYEVDPISWYDKEKIDSIVRCSINWDLDSETLGSASLESYQTNIGEKYVRIYMLVNQNGNEFRRCLGTFLFQSPSESFNGLIFDYAMDGYTPLIELKNDMPPLGYTIPKGISIVEAMCTLVDEHTRAPIVPVTSTSDDHPVTLQRDFIANTDDTWMTFLKDFMTIGGYSFDMGTRGEIMFKPYKVIASNIPSYIFNDSNSSILMPEIQSSIDMFDIPNTVEVYAHGSNGALYVKVTNDDPNSILSTVSRGRTILHRVTNPDLPIVPDAEFLTEYANNLLKQLSTLTYTVTFSHAFCDTKIGDCVLLNYERAGVRNIKATIISQSFECDTACTVNETAVYTKEYWTPTLSEPFFYGKDDEEDGYILGEGEDEN